MNYFILFCNIVAKIVYFFVVASMLHYLCAMGIVRKTKSLKTLLAAFDDSNNALSVVELVRRFKGDMNKTTVYRILERLEEDGILHSFTGNDGRKWVAKYKSENTSNHTGLHPHFKCQSCGKFECLPINLSIPAVPNYRVDSANLILVGECNVCLS